MLKWIDVITQQRIFQGRSVSAYDIFASLKERKLIEVINCVNCYCVTDVSYGWIVHIAHDVTIISIAW